MDNILNLAIAILALLESGGDPNAVNFKENAVGILQIRPIMVPDVNRIIKLNSVKALGHNRLYTLDDRFDPIYSWQLCRIYLEHYGRPTYNRLKKSCTSQEDLELLLIPNLAQLWNGGPKGDSKHSTIEYRNKAKELVLAVQRVRQVEKVKSILSGDKK